MVHSEPIVRLARRIAVATLFILAMALGACDDDSPQASNATTVPTTAATLEPTAAQGDRVKLNVRAADASSEATVNVELARTNDERMVGLSNRDSLPEDAGMLFLYDAPVANGFWMKDTYIPLDIAYLAPDGTVQEIRQGEPLDETLLHPELPYQYVLEVNQGWFERNGFGPGDTVDIPRTFTTPAGDEG